MTVAAGGSGPDVIPVRDEEVVRVARVVVIKRTRPVVAAGTGVVEIRIVAPPSSGQEDGAAGITRLLTCDPVTIDSIKSSPSPCAIVFQFLELELSRHAPAAAPLNASNVIIKVKGELVVKSTSILGKPDIILEIIV